MAAPLCRRTCATAVRSHRSSAGGGGTNVALCTLNVAWSAHALLRTHCRVLTDGWRHIGRGSDRGGHLHAAQRRAARARSTADGLPQPLAVRPCVHATGNMQHATCDRPRASSVHVACCNAVRCMLHTRRLAHIDNLHIALVAATVIAALHHNGLVLQRTHCHLGTRPSRCTPRS